MNNKGFTLIELLVGFAVLSIVMIIGLVVTRRTLATSLTQLSDLSDNEVFMAARSYTIGEHVSYNSDNYVCVDVKELIELGYLEDTYNTEIKNKTVMVTRNRITKTIERINYSDNCK